MKQIAIIRGQSHKGTTYHIAHSLVEKLGSEYDVNEFFLPTDMPEFCCGCYRCILNGIATCPHNNKMQPILDALFEADLLIFTTPVYVMRASGSMKAFLDHCFALWMNHQPDKRMFSKKAIIISAGAGGGMKKAASDIRTSVDNWGVSKIWEYRTSTAAFTWDDIKEKRKQRIENNLSKLAQNVNAKGNSVHIRLGQKFHFVCMRLMQNKDWGIPADKAYWQRMGGLVTSVRGAESTTFEWYCCMG